MLMNRSAWEQLMATAVSHYTLSVACTPELSHASIFMHIHTILHIGCLCKLVTEQKEMQTS